MGQRHLILVKLPYKVLMPISDGEKEQGLSDIVPLYHSWLYGESAVQQFIQFMDYVDNGKGKMNNIFKDNHQPHMAKTVIQSLYTVNIETGTCGKTLLEGMDIAADPSLEDNNDGCTVIDLSGEELKYSFFFFAGQEGPAFIPLTAYQYLNCYMSENVSENAREAIAKLTSRADKYQLMTKEELINMFPAMHAKIIHWENNKNLEG